MCYQRLHQSYEGETRQMSIWRVLAFIIVVMFAFGIIANAYVTVIAFIMLIFTVIFWYGSRTDLSKTTSYGHDWHHCGCSRCQAKQKREIEKTR